MALANHDRTLLQCRGLFLEYDQQVMIDRFGLKADDTFLYLPFLGKEHPGGRDGVSAVPFTLFAR